MLSPTKHKKRGAYDALSLLSLLKSTHFHVHKCHLCMRILRLECREACPRRVFYTAWMSYEFLAHRKNPTYYRSLRLSDSYISVWRYASCCRIAKKGTSAPPYPARGAGIILSSFLLKAYDSTFSRSDSTSVLLRLKVHLISSISPISECYVWCSQCVCTALAKFSGIMFNFKFTSLSRFLNF